MAAAGLVAAAAPAEEEEEAEDEEVRSNASESTALSSAPSMGRQMTELSQVDTMDIIDRQCRGFQARGTEFWLRQCTTPVERQNADCLSSIKRQISEPSPDTSFHHRGSGLNAGMLASIEDVDEARPFSSSRQVSQSQEDLSLDTGLIETAICTIVTECNFSATVSDPDSLDHDLIAVSEGFVRMSGYDREDVIGENCRFMNEDCGMPPAQRQRLTAAVKTGAPFTELLVNRRKSGDFFVNLLDLRGLVVAKNDVSREDIWVLLAVQVDVTGMDSRKLPQNNLAVLLQVASRIRKRLVKQLNSLGLAGSMMRFKIADGEEAGIWQLSSDVRWRPGEQSASSVRQSLQDLPERFRNLLSGDAGGVLDGTGSAGPLRKSTGEVPLAGADKAALPVRGEALPNAKPKASAPATPPALDSAAALDPVHRLPEAAEPAMPPVLEPATVHRLPERALARPPGARWTALGLSSVLAALGLSLLALRLTQWRKRHSSDAFGS